MNARQPIGLLATSTTALAYRPQSGQDHAAYEDMRSTLRRMFLRGLECASTAKSTAKIPTTFQLNVAAEDGERDRFETRVNMQPVTMVAYAMLETKGGADDHLHLLIASPADIVAAQQAQLQALATEYAEAECAALVDAGWQE